MSPLRLSVLLCAVLLPLCLPARAAEDLSKLSYDARLTGYEYAFGVKFFPLASQGQSLEMAYIFLPGKAGKPVVALLHGKNFNADYWASTARHLQKKGYGVLIPDQIGFGKSSKPVHYPQVNRLTHRCLIVETGNESWRFKTSTAGLQPVHARHPEYQGDQPPYAESTQHRASSLSA